MTRVAREIQAILRHAAAWCVRRRGALLLVFGALLLMTPVVMARDAAWLETWRPLIGERSIAETVSTVGRFENSTLMLAAAFASLGLVTRVRRWRDVAVACLLAGILAGITVNVLRPTFGRARPHAVQHARGLHWFEIDSELHSLPSGHAMTNAATAFAIVPLVPVAVVPAIAWTAATAWSRLRLNRHYPSDVLWGSVLGAVIGLAVGAGVRDRRREAPSTSNGRS